MSTDVTFDVGEVYRRRLSSGKARLAEIMGGHVEVESRGSLIIDADGHDLLNCGGYGVFLLGHCHPHVVEAVQRQVARLPLVTRICMEPTQAAAAEALAQRAPAGLERVYFGTSGADVVESAIKLARLNGKRRVVGVEGGFHGKSFGALSASGNPVIKEPFVPLLPAVDIVPFGDVPAMREALERDPGTACVVLEPVQGEGGVRIPPAGYLRDVADACRDAGALLIVDEIATGLGRTGVWWESEREGVTPDILLTGKALGGGIVPVGAMVVREDVFAPFDRDPHIHSATFSGAAIAMAAIAATLEVLQDEDVPARAAALGATVRARLDAAVADGVADGLVREVRGPGLMLGIEFESAMTAGMFEMELMNRRVIPNHCLNHHSVVRLTPPVCLTDGEVDRMADAVQDATDAVLASRRKRTGSRGRR